MLFDFGVFGFGLAPLLRRSDCCFSGDELCRSSFGLAKRPDVVGLDPDSLPPLSGVSFFSLPLINECDPKADFNDVPADDVLVTVALAPTIAALPLIFVLETILAVDNDENDDDGALLYTKKKNQLIEFIKN